MPNNNLVSPNIFALEQDVMNSLTEYNKQYRIYLCNIDNNRVTYVKTCAGVDTSQTALAELSTASDNVDNKISALKTAIDALPGTNEGNSGTNYINKADYLKNYDAIMSKYKTVLEKRQKLDSSLTELYEIGDTTGNFYQKQLISTSYTKILLTILATSLTVAAFMTMRNK